MLRRWKFVRFRPLVSGVSEADRALATRALRGQVFVPPSRVWRSVTAEPMTDAPTCDVVIFGPAIRLSLADRALYLDQACSGDEKLRQRMEGLLRAHDHLGDFMANLPPEVPAGESGWS
jgi:hypothetical protein